MASGREKKAPLAVIAAGGTGGHMFPAQALAEDMLHRGWRVILSTDARGARYADGFPEAVERRVVASATFARGGVLAKLAVPFKVLGGIISASVSMIMDRPSVVAGFGGYPSIPALGAAWILRIPRLIHEQNGVLGRVNRLFARRVSAIACGTWPTVLPAGLLGHDIGNPVRASVRDKAAAPYIAPGDYPMSVVIIGGSQGARILSDVVPAAIAMVPPEVRQHLRVAQQARPEDLDRVQASYDAAGIPAEVAPFFADVPRRFSEAQLVIARAGASTLADLTVIGRPSILVPLASALRDEQTVNARGLVAAQAAVMIPESQFTAEALAEHITKVLTTPDAASRMAAAATALGKPDAAMRLSDLAERLAGPPTS